MNFGTMAEIVDADNQYVCGIKRRLGVACTHKLHMKVRILLVPPHYGNPKDRALLLRGACQSHISSRVAFLIYV